MYGKGAANSKLMDPHGQNGNLREMMRVGLDTVINENADDDADDDENALETRDFYDDARFVVYLSSDEYNTVN